MTRSLGGRGLLVTVTALSLALVTSSVAHAGDEVFEGVMQGNHASVAGGRAADVMKESEQAPPELRLVRFERAAMCREVAGVWTRGSTDGTCVAPADTAGARECPPGDTALQPMWRQQRATPTSPWGPWERIDEGGCGTDLLPTLTEADFRRLPLPAPRLTMQPDRGWVLVNIETIVYTDPTPVTLRTELLGHGVTVEATPVRWTYDFGDGHTLTTRDPGAPHPAFDVVHAYEAPGTATITLTAEWTGRYLVDGSPAWRDVAGTATTTVAGATFTVEERTSRLVSGLCTDTPRPPDC